MFYISFKTTKILTLQQELEIEKVCRELVSHINKDFKDNLMVHIKDNQLLYYRDKEIDCMLIECKIFKNFDKRSKNQFIRELMEKVEIITKISMINQYIIFDTTNDWGMNGELIN